MKHYLFLVIICITLSASLVAQNIVTINYDYEKLSKITSSADVGNLFPLSTEKSLINIGYTKLGILNNKSGEIIHFFDESQLAKKLDNIIANNYQGNYLRFSDDDFKTLPLCQRQPYIYQRFYKIESTNLYACEIRCIIRNDFAINGMAIITCIGFFTPDLDLVELYERDEYEGALLMSGKGGFFIGKNDFYIKKAIPSPNETPDFIHFQLKNGRFCLIEALENMKAASKEIYFPGRFLSMINMKNQYYINSGTQLIQTKELGQVGTAININLKEDEVVAILKKINDNLMLGLRVVLDEEGAASMATLFQCDVTFNKKNDIKKYDQLLFGINSIEIKDNKVYIFIFDEIQKKYLLEIRTITS